MNGVADLTKGLPRSLRAAMLALVVFALAAGAHVVGHADLPHPLLLAVLLALTAAIAAPLTGRRLGRGAALLSLAGGQLLLHSALTALSSTGCATGPLAGVSGEHGAHVVGPVGACASAAVSAGSAAGSAAGSPAGGALGAAPGWMLAAHVVATLLAALVLASAERALFSLRDWLAPLVRAVPVVVLPVAGRHTATGAPAARPLLQPLLRVLRGRAPPPASGVLLTS